MLVIIEELCTKCKVTILLLTLVIESSNLRYRIYITLILIDKLRLHGITIFFGKAAAGPSRFKSIFLITSKEAANWLGSLPLHSVIRFYAFFILRNAIDALCNNLSFIQNSPHPFYGVDSQI